MPPYRIYVTDEAGHIIAPATVVECADDAEAIAQATALRVGAKVVEIWDGNRQVAVLPGPDPTAPTPTG
jgi:hypothetical protein